MFGIKKLLCKYTNAIKPYCKDVTEEDSWCEIIYTSVLCTILTPLFIVAFIVASPGVLAVSIYDYYYDEPKELVYEYVKHEDGSYICYIYLVKKNKDYIEVKTD